MPKQYEMGPHAIINDQPSLTEQEWKDQCDINKMLKAASRGTMIMGSGAPQIYGEDDLTMDGVSHRIKKAKLEAELAKISKETELTEEEIAKIPPKVREKFTFRKKAVKTPVAGTTPATPSSKDATVDGSKKEPEAKPQAP